MEAIQHTYTANTVQHGHLSTPKGNPSSTLNIKSDLNYDIGIVEDYDDFETDFDCNIDNVNYNLNWFNNYLIHLLNYFQSLTNNKVKYSIAEPSIAHQSPLYLLNQTFRI